MACPEEMISYMHEYLDENIEPEQERLLKEHLASCKDCQVLFHELEKAVALIQGTANVHAPEDFTKSVMARLPREKKKVGMQRWMKRHPFVTAAAMFIVLMTGSLFSAWGNDGEFSTTKADQVVIENDTVVVPAGKVVKGDLTVKNGNIKIEGEVQGNVTVINGENYLASAGKVTGEIEEVDKAFDWIWYKIKKTATDLVDFKEEQ